MADIESNPLSTITAKAKAAWKKNVRQKEAKATRAGKSKLKSSKQTSNKNKNRNKKRGINQIKNGPPLKKRKHSSRKKKIDFDLSLEEQNKRSVIKLQNMPTGLEEEQISIFFNQFGHVTRFCLKRHRYGRSLRYGYVEFDHPEVAKVVEDTLDCTSMYGQMIVCKEIPPEKVHGAQFFKTNSIEDARCFKKLENEKVRWSRAATIANLEFQFPQWHTTLIRDESIINDNLRKNGVNYTFRGFTEEIKRQKSNSNANVEATVDTCAFLSSESESDGEEDSD